MAGQDDARPLFAALDLGTNNCRLLIAEPRADGFQVVEAFSQIVRLGEGLKEKGGLQENAMRRALDALKLVAERMARREGLKFRCVATQACREAANRDEFIERVRTETGIRLEIISPREEARLAVLGCLDLFDPEFQRCLVIDIGGGSTEVCQVEIPRPVAGAEARTAPRILCWSSSNVGVVNLSERHRECEPRIDWYHAMRDDALAILDWPPRDNTGAVREAACDNCYVIGTSGTVTSLAGVYKKLPRYDRRAIDGTWLPVEGMRSAIDELLALPAEERAKNPCVGHDRADLVLAGCAIFEAVLERAPCSRIRVADRGLREGILMSLIHGPKRRPRRRGGSRRRKA
jgi:exopolyphosphatase / guanosine-5'-triphosphate,3'-diphosphate pyrophosphatase